MIDKTGTICTCEVCGYRWKRRNRLSVPPKCAGCQSVYWNDPIKGAKKRAIREKKLAQNNQEIEQEKEAKFYTDGTTR